MHTRYWELCKKGSHLDGCVEESVTGVFRIARHKSEAGQCHCGLKGDRDLVSGLKVKE